MIFLDGDLDISPDSIKDYVERLSTSDLVIASKRHPESNVRIPRSRAFLSRAFNLLIRVATGIPQKDTQAGFKVGNGEKCVQSSKISVSIVMLLMLSYLP